ncbi:MAG: peptidoglycan DD-metalloendopeptidase family protein [Nitrospirae bacterium]|nr:peptidoglycan DD-metalloendopeptidase family protein [Nitrospirota bacterium]
MHIALSTGKSGFFIFLAFFLLNLILQFPAGIPGFGPSCAYAERAQEEYKRIQKDIRTHKQKLESVKKQEQSVAEELRKMTSELAEIDQQLSAKKNKIKQLNSNILALQGEIAGNSAILQEHKIRLKKRLRMLAVLNVNKDALLILLSGEDFTQTLRIERYLKDVSDYDYGLIKKYKTELQILAKKNAELKTLYAALKEEETSLRKLEIALKEKKKERETLLAQVRKEKGIYENMIKELRETSNRLLAIIQEADKREREARKKRNIKTKPGKKEEEEAPDDSVFRKLKGKLPWPVAGNVALQYGTQVDPIFNLPVFRSGIHVKAESGAQVKAVYDGKVVFADQFKGYGQLIIISHGSGYHTLYGNLSKIFSKNGAIIKEYQTIGEVGESSMLGTGGLYFEIRFKGKPIDPQQWLKK